MWKIFIPLMKMRHAFEPEMLNQVEFLAVFRLRILFWLLPTSVFLYILKYFLFALDALDLRFQNHSSML